MAEASDPKPALRWLEPEWRAEADAWIQATLVQAGIDATGPVEQPHVFWWSTVLRIPTAEGELFFKAVAPPHEFEPLLTRELARWEPGRTPELLAVDAERGWTLMRDGGTRLRELIRSAADVRRWERVLPPYAELQIDLAPRRDELLALGVPDQRLAVLPAQLERLLDERPVLRLDEPDGLTQGEYRRLRAAAPELAAMCADLAAVGIPETLQHDDFHDGNVLVRDGRAVFFDWGDSCVSHPFHTLVVTLRSIAYRQGVAPGSPQLERVRDAYLEPWTAFATRADLLSAFAIAYRTGTLCRALAWHRFVAAREPPADEEDADAVPYGLKLFLGAGPIGTWS
jgi:Phosphotransferase enzyme family